MIHNDHQHFSIFLSSPYLYKKLIAISIIAVFQEEINLSRSHPKPTLKLSIGWIHSESGHGSTLMQRKKGGGTEPVDCDKSLDLEQLTEKAKNVFFGEGINLLSGVAISDCEYYMAEFNGKRLSLASGAPFSVGKFVEEYGRTPVRVYLHTVRV